MFFWSPCEPQHTLRVERIFDSVRLIGLTEHYLVLQLWKEEQLCGAAVQQRDGSSGPVKAEPGPVFKPHSSAKAAQCRGVDSH